MTTVACVWVKGHVPFTAQYVVRLAAMVKRWMDRPYRFVCLTDNPQKLAGYAGIVAVRIPRPQGFMGWWSKLQLFNGARGLSGRVLYLDLDTLIVGALGPIVDFPAAFALVPDGAPDWRPKGGHQVVKRFNSSVMVWNAGEQNRLYDDWQPEIAKRLHGDQDWVGEQAPDAAAMPAIWFPRLSEVIGGPPAGARVVLAKVPKNVKAAQTIAWVREVWV
jgi:hypothetical protein